MVLAGNKAKCLSSVNRTTETIHHHHHHHAKLEQERKKLSLESDYFKVAIEIFKFATGN